MKMPRSLVAYASIVLATACAQIGVERQRPDPAPDIALALEKSGRAVVSVSVTAEAPYYLGQSIPDQTHGDILIQWRQRSSAGPYSPSGSDRHLAGSMGSGFIFSRDGLVLTSAHVLGGAKFASVTLPDGREFDAKVVGGDLRSDIAVLRIDRKHLPVVTIGDSSQLRPGNWVVAVGSPYGFQNSASLGIVSAVRRTMSGDLSAMPLIQSDVALNPGSSGGPLLNAKGEVVGISNHIFTRTGGFQGLSFAIPINRAMRVAHQLVASSHVTRGRLGVGVQDVDQDLADAFGLPAVAGALIDQVEPGGPAAQAGMKIGDVVTQIGDVYVVDAMALAIATGDLPPGNPAELRLVRRGAPHSVTVVIGALPPLADPPKLLEAASVGANGPSLMVRQLAASEVHATGVQGGVLVERASGAARRAGILPGDIILAVNDIVVATAAQFHSAISAKGRKVALLVLRGDVRTFIPIDTG